MKTTFHFLTSAILLVFFSQTPINQTTAQCICTNCPQDLPDNTNQDFYMNVIDTGGDCDLSTNPLVGVNLYFTHEYLGDLTITLISPSGETARLVGLEGYHGDTHYMCGLLDQFECADTFQLDFVDGSAPLFHSQTLTASAQPYNTGTFTANDGHLLSTFTGPACGTWRINVNDNQAFDVGEFLDFSLVFSDETGMDCNSVAPLPIELVDFEGERVKDKVVLSWETLSETNNQHFNIQRSTDGITFSSIGQIQGSGTSIEQKSYIFRDARPSFKPSYYRLEQEDFDGSKTYSSVIFLEGRMEVPILVSPNPTHGVTTLTINSLTHTTGHVKVLNLAGKLVQDYTLMLEPGVNLFEVDLSSLSRGIYFVEAFEETFRFVKL